MSNATEKTRLHQFRHCQHLCWQWRAPVSDDRAHASRGNCTGRSMTGSGSIQNATLSIAKPVSPSKKNLRCPVFSDTEVRRLKSAVCVQLGNEAVGLQQKRSKVFASPVISVAKTVPCSSASAPSAKDIASGRIPRVAFARSGFKWAASEIPSALNTPFTILAIEQIAGRRPNKSRHKGRTRIVVDLLWRPDLLDFAIAP